MPKKVDETWARGEKSGLQKAFRVLQWVDGSKAYAVRSLIDSLLNPEGETDGQAESG